MVGDVIIFLCKLTNHKKAISGGNREVKNPLINFIPHNLHFENLDIYNV